MTVNNLTDEQRKAIEDFFTHFRISEVDQTIDETFQEMLSSESLPGSDDLSFDYWLLSELKKLVRVLEPTEVKKRRLQQELESIQ